MISLLSNRFDVDTKNGFMDLYMKLDETVAPKSDDVSATEKKDEEIAFWLTLGNAWCIMQAVW